MPVSVTDWEAQGEGRGRGGSKPPKPPPPPFPTPLVSIIAGVTARRVPEKTTHGIIGGPKKQNGEIRPRIYSMLTRGPEIDAEARSRMRKRRGISLPS